MMKAFVSAIAALAGVAVACQASTNAALASRVGLPMALLINTTVVFIGTILFFVSSLVGGGRTAVSLAGVPWPLLMGGIFGFTVIASMAYTLPRIGAALAVALMVLGQGVSALVIDHFGLWGNPVVPATAPRLIGVLLLVAGVALLRR